MNNLVPGFSSFFQTMNRIMPLLAIIDELRIRYIGISIRIVRDKKWRGSPSKDVKERDIKKWKRESCRLVKAIWIKIEKIDDSEPVRELIEKNK